MRWLNRLQTAKQATELVQAAPQYAANDAKPTTTTSTAAPPCYATDTALDATIDPVPDTQSDTRTARIELFQDRGLTLSEAKELAQRLHQRDADWDDRRACLECTNLRAVGLYQCTKPRLAGLSSGFGSLQLGADWVVLMQRCDGFKAVV